MTTCDRAFRLPPEGDQAEVEMRQLMAGLRRAARIGLRPARRLAGLFEKIVEEYCVEFEQRATLALARLVAR